MTYPEAQAARAAIDSEVSRLGAELRAFPSGAMGLTPDHVKASPQYRAVKSAYDAAFARLRRFNSWYLKAFAAEIRAERKAKRG